MPGVSSAAANSPAQYLTLSKSNSSWTRSSASMSLRSFGRRAQERIPRTFAEPDDNVYVLRRTRLAEQRNGHPADRRVRYFVRLEPERERAQSLLE
jgi:hypothetical protein